MSEDAAGRDDASTLPAGMSGASESTVIDLEQLLLGHIEAACERFKAALTAGERPRIEDVLGEGLGPGHPVLLRELLTLELADRRRQGDCPEPGEYQARFPGQDAAIRAAFEALDQPPTERAAGTCEIERVEKGQGRRQGQGREAETRETEVGPGGHDRPANEPGPLTSTELEILGELGRGGMGVVYRAYDRRRNQVVALKVLPQTAPSALYRFKQEFRALAGVTHENLVTLYELISDGQRWSFTMELVDGVHLLASVRQESGAPGADPEAKTVPAAAPPGRDVPGAVSRPPPEMGRLRDAFRQLAAGVSAVHEAGKVHRDLKPSNVLVTKTGRVVILDMGIAADLDRAGWHQSTEQHILGTIAYMAPEQAGGQPVSAASDWYSVGVMLYEALTGRLPFSGAPLEVLMEKQKSDPLAPGALVPGLPDDLGALCVDLLRRDSEARPSGREVIRRLGGAADRPGIGIGIAPGSRPSQGQGGPLPLIGRERHVEALSAAFEAMKRGRTVTCSVQGRSGVGKSALVQHFLDDILARDEAVVLSGRCYEQESVPYKAFDSLIDALSRYLRRLPRWEAEALLPRDVQLLGRLFPVLRRVAAVAEAPSRGLEIPDPQEVRQRAFTALRELLARLGDRKPLILAIDDLQWADVDSAALLSDVLRPPGSPSLLLLACSRSEETATNPFVQALIALGEPAGPAIDRRELAVEALTHAESADLARTLLGRDDPAASAQADAIARESGGNPFFVSELVNYLQSGAGAEAGERSHASRAIALDEVLWERVVRLPEQARRLLEVIAVSGQPLSQSAACRAVDLGPEERSALALLRAGRLIRSTSQAEREVIETYHDRVRESVVAQLAPEVREDCHQRLALALLASGETDPETLAVHFRGANQPERAGEYFARAADQAAEALAFDRAAKLYRLALELRPAAGEEGRRLRSKLGDALANAGRGAEAAREYLAARQGAHVAETLELERRAAMQFLISGYIDEGIALLRTVLAAVGMTLPSTPRRALGTYLASSLLLRLRGFGFRERDNSQVSAEDLTRIDICWTCVAGFSLVDPISAAVFQARNLRLALRAGEPYRVARALAMQAFHAAARGGPSQDRTRRILQAAQELAERVGHPHALGMAALASGVAVYCLGRWREAQEACDRASELFRGRCTGIAWELTTARLISLPALIWMGDHAEAFRRLHLYRQEAQERGELYSMASLGVFSVHESLAADDPERARTDLAAVMGVWSHRGFHVQHMEALWVQLHIDLYCEDGASAWDRLSGHWPALERSLIMRVQVIRIGMRHLRARCALAKAVASADPRPYLAAAERDARRLERERMAWGEALAQLIRAGVAAGRGDAAGAVARLDAAVTGLEANDMRYPAAGARRRLGELIGGDAGRTLIAQVNSWMTAQKIRDPGRFTAMLAPGFQIQN